MKPSVFILLLLFASFLAAEDQPETKDIDVEEGSEDLERRHRKRKKQQYQAANSGPCGSLGYGRTFGEKLFGWGTPSNTYVSAPVMNYYIGCGPAPAPQPYFPVPSFPQFQQPGGFGGGHHQHNHNHHHGHQHGGGFSGHSFNQQPNFNFQSPIQDQYQPYSQYQRPNRPVQGVVTAAASGLGTALADYITGGSRPKKTYKQLTKTVNQLFKPIYKLF